MLALLLDSNDAACQAPSGITSGERQFVTSLAQIIDVLMHDDRSANDGVLSDQRDEVVGDGHVDLAVRTRLHVAEVAHVASVIGGSAVSLGEGIEMRTGGGAAISQIAELNHTESSRRR